MTSLLDKLAAAAAAAVPPAGGPEQAAQAAQGGMDPNAGMMAPPDPIEQDNARLTAILQNLQLRQEVVQAQAELEQLMQQINQQNRRPPQDPDAPRNTGNVVSDVTTSSGLSELLRKTPKSRRNAAEHTPSEGRKSKLKAGGRSAPNTPGDPNNELLRVAPINQPGSQA